MFYQKILFSNLRIVVVGWFSVSVIRILHEHTILSQTFSQFQPQKSREMASDYWLTWFYVSKFIKNSNKNSSQSKIVTPSVNSSIMIRQLALDRALRRELLRERRKALRQKYIAVTNIQQSRRVSFIIEDYGEEEWTTEDESDIEEDKTKEQESAAMRESRLRVMNDLPKCVDEDMAERYKTLKQVCLSVLKKFY